MSNTGTTRDTLPSTEERRALMIELWTATLTRLLERMQNPPKGGLNASFYDLVVTFLAHSGINVDTVVEAREALSSLDAEIARQIAEVIAEDEPPTPPATVKAPESAARVVTPLEQPFEVRTPRS